MKLLHKLLPVATIASVATVVTPLVTSCSNGVSLSFNYLEDGKLREYTAKYDPVSGDETEVVDSVALTSIYYRDWSRNKRLFADDMLYFINGLANHMEGISMSEATSKITVYSVNAKKQIASFNVYFSFVGTYEDEKIEAKAKINVKNFPMVVSQYVPSAIENLGWGFAPKFWNTEDEKDVPVSTIITELNKNKGWKWSADCLMEGEEIKFNFSESKLPAESDKQKLLDASNFLCPQLYHLKDNDKPIPPGK